ncbi:erythrocyte membrane protein 1 [Plasmodium falciparum RAJ116]|uniref:Erythrocyte membrane protein 1 n=1 Tax=Plasmodium falciparum RAJ116 TaxID=580058 RepID=A0A0L0CS10_PLAFA|nr:erythrocyte membrane protein 1 [Plasmodium falciparum RAJ116]
MAPQGGSRGGVGEIDDKDAKHLLDSIGEKVYKEKVKNGANDFSDELKGNLNTASGSGGELASTTDTCALVEQYRSKADTKSERNPCKELSGKVEPRFSDTLGGQCTNEKMRSGGKGACAPYRRLHLCHHNLETIETTSTTKHDLLAEVCYAAKEEGESLKNYHAQYQTENTDFKTNICTVLARSFADIGDIIRGKDPFYGNTQEKEKREQLENNLKEIFKKIYDNLDKKDRYKDTTNFFQLREDWWTANRETVWKALTCSEQLSNASYFRATCSDERGGALANHKCRCPNGKNADQVPTYFDYVPQYLRWFDEWAEDFCRKRKHKLENAKNKCRRPNGKDKYCDLNRHDCKKTVRGDHVFFEDDDCNDCSVACKPFVKWIDNQKLEFEKQKKKYKSEIEKYTNGESRGTGGSKRKKRGAGKSNYDRYESKFYNKLKEKNNYGTVDGFLELLNKEKTCTKNGDIEEGGKIDFKNVNSAKNSGGDGNNKTFYRTKYCEACPWCGIEEQKVDGKWKAKNDGDCNPGKDYKNYKKTEIPILTGDKTKGNMVKKYNKFCNANDGNGAPVAAPDTATSGHNTDYATTGYCGGTNNSDKDPSLCEKWTCYYKKNGKDVGKEDINFCVQQEQDTDKKKEMSMHYNAFFWDWVYHMLHDSLDWRNELKSCIDKDKSEQCENKCNSKCDCFLKWVNEKKTEWDKIKEHFYKQEGFDNKGENGISVGGLGMTHDFVLNCLLKKDLLLKSIKDTHVDAKDIDRIDKMLKEEENQVTGVASGVSGTGSANGKNSIIDKLLDHELTDAQNCLKTHTSDPCPQQESLARSDEPQPRPAEEGAGDGSDDASSEDEEEEEEEDSTEDTVEDTVEDGEATKAVEVQVDGDGSAPPPASQDEVNPCKIVQTLFENPDDFKVEACNQKYAKNNSRLGWKCVTTTSGDQKAATTGSSGSICIPPRRRKLYIHDLQSLSGEDGKTQSHKQLLEWFVKSAAVETFFLWDRYKKEWMAQHGAGATGLQPLNGDTISGEQTPEKLLQSGTIPPDFLRLMFYTLGDYRDLCVGNTNIVVNASGTEDEKQKMKQILEKIKEHINNGSSSPPPGEKNPVQTTTKPEDWWNKHGQHIWNGMICALTYEDNGEKGTPQVDDKVKDKLWDEDKKKPKKTDNGHDYTYEKVVLKDESSETQAKSTETPSASSGDNTPLTQFVLRPTYFRYLEEWGETFCRERAKRLAQIKHECKVEANGGGSSRRGGNEKKPKCSCYGEHCDDQLDADPSTDADLKCPSCADSCRLYKKWIKKKRTEYDKQKEAYGEQQKKCQKENNGAEGNNGDNGFCVTLKSLSDAAQFLERLGPCKKDNGSSTVDFNKEGDTFKPAENCAPCSKFTAKLEKCNCTGPSKANTCNGTKKNSIDATDIENGGNSAEDIDMLVSDDSPNGFNGLDEACKDAHIFKGIRKEQWKCRNVCGYVVCKPENGNTETGSGKKNDGKHIITIRGLVEHWVHNFLEDYNRIRKKLNPCMKNGKGSICKKDCQNKYKCAVQWISKKKQEWQQIKKSFLNQYKMDSQEYYSVKTILEKLQPQTDVNKAIKPCDGLEKFQNSTDCTVAGSSEKESGKQDKKSDIIDCLLNKLEEKANECKDLPSDTDCSQEQTLEDDETFDDDIETEEAKNMVPTICKDVLPKTETAVEEETCDTQPPQTDVKVEEEKKEEEKPKGNEQEEAPPHKPPSPPRRKPPPQLLDDPLLKTALVTSTLAWSVGIGFAAFTYFFLKKKTKHPVDLFSVIDIPKSDYDIPTKLSPNRYIPYTSGKYRGKRYIYLEGDSGTDSGYTDHYSDITSSSESEYEELDINDIYVPGSPKYKTLIEVVLEPSGKLSGNTIPTSGNNTTASDTQNDIQNDGIPSSKITDNEWNTLKDDFIYNMLQNTQNTEPNMLGYNVDNNTHPTMSRHNVDQKPFITSIHDRNLLSGEEYNYDMSTNSGNNNLYSGENNVYGGIDPTGDNRGLTSGKHDSYSGIDLINDSLSGDYDIYDELLKRKENELFGTEHHPKRTTTNHFATPTRDDPLHNQLNLFHTWLDRHRDMCEKLKNDNERLAKLKEEWENETHSGNIHTSDSNKTLNTDVSIQIHMDNPKPINEFTNMDTNMDTPTMHSILEDLDKPFNEPYYYDMYDDDIYYDVNDHDASTVDSNAMDVPSKVQIEMDVNTKLVKEKYPIADVWDI